MLPNSSRLSQATRPCRGASKISGKEGTGALLNQLLVVILLAGATCAQVAPSSFVTDGRVVPAPDIQPLAPSVTGNGLRALPTLLPQPQGQPTLMGGVIFKLDRVRDRMTLDLFGGGKTRILFDPRTHVYRDGMLGSLQDLQNGARVYVDTVLTGTDIFAQSIRVRTKDATGQSSGQVVSYDSRTGSLVLNDTMSPRQLKLRVLPVTVVSREGEAVSADDLRPGTLVAATFTSNADGQPAAHTISILAAPGNTFVFAGRVVQLDLHLDLLVIADPRDQKTYEVTFDPNIVVVNDRLREGAMVEATTRFDGGRYLASAIKIDSNPN
jgi:hypothetical protein